MKKILRAGGAVVLSLTAISMAFLAAACSSAPYAKSYATLSDTNREVHDYDRKAQWKANKNRHPNASTELEQISKKTESSDCYKILSATSQWGIVEPESVFIGESMGDSSTKAYVMVPPVLEDANYPTPADEENYKVFRLDRDAPFATDALELIRRVMNDPSQCVRFVTAPRGDTQAAVIAVNVIHKSAYRAPVEKKPETPAVEKKPEAAPTEKAPAEKAPA